MRKRTILCLVLFVAFAGSILNAEPEMRSCESKWLTGSTYGPGTFQLSYGFFQNGQIVPYTPSLPAKLSPAGESRIRAASMWAGFKKLGITSYDLVGESVLYKMTRVTQDQLRSEMNKYLSQVVDKAGLAKAIKESPAARPLPKSWFLYTVTIRGGGTLLTNEPDYHNSIVSFYLIDLEKDEGHVYTYKLIVPVDD